MAQPPPEDKKPDFSSLPRGAIGIKGLPVSRNTRLPSIRSPRDLTLGALPKKTYMPNIPVRREKKPPVSDKVLPPKQENVKFDKQKNSLQANDRGRGRGRGHKQIIQTQGSIFSEGIAQDPLTRKEKLREAYQRSDYAYSRGISVKKEKNDDIVGVSKKMDNLLRDDFIDDGDDDDVILLKPTIFPGMPDVKKETKSEVVEPTAKFDPNIAREMGFDVNQVAKFIKKEKDMEAKETQEIPLDGTSSETPSNGTTLSIGKSVNDIKDLLSGDASTRKLVLLQFPQITAANLKMDDAEPSHKQPANADSKVPMSQNLTSTSIKSLPEGYIGKLKVMKSGKAKLVIGSVELCLDNIDSFYSKHEIVSIRTDSSSGDLTVLGYLEQKVKFVPDEDILLA